MKIILITGGAGYIGSQAALSLRDNGYEPLILDNFSNSHISSIKNIGVDFIHGDIRSEELLNDVFSGNNIDGVMHFAGLAYVGESMISPGKYYDTNISGTISLLNSMAKHGVRNFVFSSTCSTYGVPSTLPIQEVDSQNPINPYGKSKLIVEGILGDYEKVYGIKSVVFRYFNVSGADRKGRVGECHQPETHLIPLAIHAALDEGEFFIYGDDYPTKDGTCIRDYVHVQDIANAHILGLEYLHKGGDSNVFNLGNGMGYSVLDVIDCVERISGKVIRRAVKGRRPGDPPELFCSSSKAMKILSWAKEGTLTLDDMVTDSLGWELRKRALNKHY